MRLRPEVNTEMYCGGPETHGMRLHCKSGSKVTLTVTNVKQGQAKEHLKR